MSAFLKNWPVKVFGARCLSVWGPLPSYVFILGGKAILSTFRIGILYISYLVHGLCTQKRRTLARNYRTRLSSPPASTTTLLLLLLINSSRRGCISSSSSSNSSISNSSSSPQRWSLVPPPRADAGARLRQIFAQGSSSIWICLCFVIHMIFLMFLKKKSHWILRGLGFFL